MITLFSGIPGSGKSYKMVHDLAAVKDKYFVVHNIDGLKSDYLGDYGVNFIEYCKNVEMDVTDFLSKDYQLEYSDAIRKKYGRNCLVIVDEAAEWFDKRKQTLKQWLSYHRHLNQDIWLVTHKSTNLPSIYRSYIEVEYRAKSSSIIALPGFFFYNRIAGGERIGYTFCRKKQEIFKLYKSQEAKFEKKKPSILMPVILIFIIAGIVLFLTAPARTIGKNLSPGKKQEEKINEKSDLMNERNEPVKLRYAGRIGNISLIEDRSCGKIIKSTDINGIMELRKQSNSIEIFDYNNRKRMTINAYNIGELPERTRYEGGPATKHDKKRLDK